MTSKNFEESRKKEQILKGFEDADRKRTVMHIRPSYRSLTILVKRNVECKKSKLKRRCQKDRPGRCQDRGPDILDVLRGSASNLAQYQCRAKEPSSLVRSDYVPRFMLILRS